MFPLYRNQSIDGNKKSDENNSKLYYLFKIYVQKSLQNKYAEFSLLIKNSKKKMFFGLVTLAYRISFIKYHPEEKATYQKKYLICLFLVKLVMSRSLQPLDAFKKHKTFYNLITIALL